MSADFTPIIPDPPAQPSKGTYTDLQPFRFWCQKVLPLVYDESLSYYEVLCKLVDYLNKTMEDVGVLHDDVDNMFESFQDLTNWTDQQIDAVVTAYGELQEYVNNYFDNLDVQNEINNKLDQMSTDGTLTNLISPLLPNVVSAWLTEHVSPETGYVIDDTLTIAGAAADAKAVGDSLLVLRDEVNKLIEIPFEIEGNGYVEYDSGNILETNNYRYSQPIHLLKGVKYTLTSVNYTAVAAFALCDEDGTNIRPVVHGLYDGEGVYTTVYYTPNTDCYVIISYNVVKTPYLQATEKMDVILNKVNNDHNTVQSISNIIDATETTVISKNIFNPETSVPGYLGPDGETLVQYSDWYTSDFLSINDFAYVFTSCEHSGTREALPMYFMCIYDENKDFIAQFNSQLNPYEILDYVYYIRFSYHHDTDKDIQVENGQTFTSYVPYQESIQIGNKIWDNKTWACLGDSLTEHNERTKLNYHDYISNLTGIKIVNLGKSGTGYKSGGNEYAFRTRVSSIPLDASVVTIFGSVNDMADTLGEPTDTGTTTVCGCINTTIDAIVTRIPTVSLGIVAPTPTDDYPPSVANNAMELYTAALKEICDLRSIPFLDLYHCSNLRPWTSEGRAACFSKDDGNGTHPNEYGHKLIASRFKGFLDTLVI